MNKIIISALFLAVFSVATPVFAYGGGALLNPSSVGVVAGEAFVKVPVMTCHEVAGEVVCEQTSTTTEIFTKTAAEIEHEKITLFIKTATDKLRILVFSFGN